MTGRLLPAFVVVWGCSGGDSPPALATPCPPPPVPAAVALERAGPAEWIRALADPEPARWVEAQYHLVHAGADGLAALEADPGAWRCVEDRAARVVRTALHASVELAVLDDKPHLRALVADGLAASREAARPLAKDPDVLRVRDLPALRAIDLGDYGVAVLLELTRAPAPAVRVRAAEMFDLGDGAAHPRLLEMAADRTPLTVHGEDYVWDTTVGEYVSRNVIPSRGVRSGPTPPSERYRQYFTILSGPPPAATHDLASQAMASGDWATLWARLRPLWDEYWRAVSGATSVAERHALGDAWLRARAASP